MQIGKVREKKRKMGKVRGGRKISSGSSVSGLWGPLLKVESFYF